MRCAATTTIRAYGCLTDGDCAEIEGMAPCEVCAAVASLEQLVEAARNVAIYEYDPEPYCTRCGKSAGSAASVAGQPPGEADET